MEWLKSAISFFLHIDKHLGEVIHDYGTWTYVILIAIVFCETGLVVTPFLPGDSLLFAAGTFAALGSLNVHLLFLALTIAAIVGDSVNYAIGAYLGPRALKAPGRFLKQEHLDRTREFYARHGGKAIILARFVPIIRTFAPFVAGIGTMNYAKFLLYNIVGGIAWVALFVYLGYFFGTRQFVKDNFSLVILVIIGISVLPILREMIVARRKRRATQFSSDSGA